MDAKALKELAEAGDWTGLAKALVELFPQGLVGERWRARSQFCHRI